MSQRAARTYDKELKLNAIKLCLDSRRSRRQIAYSVYTSKSIIFKNFKESGSGWSLICKDTNLNTYLKFIFNIIGIKEKHNG